MIRTIQTCPGIGDSVWLLQKLINSKEKFHFQISGAQPQRGKQLFDMLPQVAASCEYVKGLNYQAILDASAPFQNKKFKSIKVNAFALQINTHLEAGKRIEEYLPDLPITYKLPYITEGSGFDETVFKSVSHTKMIGIYGSTYGTSKNWGGWDDGHWYDLISKFHAEDPNICFVVIGATFDIDMASRIIKRMDMAKISYINTIGKPMTYVIDMLRVLDYFIGFPSGLSIINETLHKKTFMFYPDHLQPMINAWPEMGRIESNDYIGSLFVEPMEVFKLIMDKADIL